MLDENRLVQIATEELMPFLGVAAEFIVQDGLDLLNARASDANLGGDARLRIFFIGLRGLVDSSVPFDRVRDRITKRMR